MGASSPRRGPTTLAHSARRCMRTPLHVTVRECAVDVPSRHRFALSDAKALRISDCEIPNCRAILDGVMPALKAARTAFNFPCVKGTAATASTTADYKGFTIRAFKTPD